MTQEANLARNGIALHDDHANATTLADQARGELGSKLDDTIKSNRNAQVKFLNENIRSTSINSPEQIAAVQDQAERLYPTKPETLLQSGELRQLAAKAQAPQAPQILPKDVLQSRIDRIDDHISTPVMSEQGNVPAVNTTAMANLGLGRAEQSLQSFPFVHGAREAQMASMNINNSGRVLQKVGMNLPDNIRPGYDGNSQVHDLLDKAYEDIKPKVGGVVTPEFKATIAALRQKAYQTHSGQDAWNANIEPFVSKIEAKKTFDGHDYQELSTGMRSVSKILQDEPADINVQNVGHMAQNIRQANVNMVGTNNPTVGKDLGNLNDAWKHQLIIEDATRRAKSSNPDGIYSPQHLTMAVSKFDNSVGDGDLGRGKAFEQDYARDAARVLGGTPASTSNPYHALMAGATLAGGGFVAHKLGQDGYATLASLPIGAIAAGYLPIGKQISKGISSGAIGQIAGKIAGPALDAARSIPVVGSKLPSNDDIISQILASMATKTLGN